SLCKYASNCSIVAFVITRSVMFKLLQTLNAHFFDILGSLSTNDTTPRAKKPAQLGRVIKKATFVETRVIGLCVNKSIAPCVPKSQDVARSVYQYVIGG
ncbi:MAG: hypothetical protein ACLTNY_05015, partial [Blautia massiliensis (ex Durand et al. 2017)]